MTLKEREAALANAPRVTPTRTEEERQRVVQRLEWQLAFLRRRVTQVEADLALERDQPMEEA